MTGRESEFVQDALSSTWISGGPYVERLESEMAEALQAKHVLCVNNGTSAIELALRSLDLLPGDEVIVPDFSFIAPAAMVMSAGLVPHVADVDPETWCLSVDGIRRAYNGKTKAIIAVHTYGNVCDMTAVMKFAGERGIPVIEDGAEALFSKHANKPIGTWGEVGTFSLHATKNITTGEGGLVTCGSADRWKKMKKIRDHGMQPDRRYWHDVVGHNFRMTNLQASIGCAQMQAMTAMIESRKQTFHLYRELFSNQSAFRLQKIDSSTDPVMWTLGVYVDPTVVKVGRDEIIKRMGADGVETRPGFYPASVLPPYKNIPGGGDCPHSKRIAANVVVLPFFVGMTRDEVQYSFDSLKKAAEVA
jgi:perosamine synthetase